MQWIRNFQELATTPERETVLNLIETGYNAINTDSVIQKALTVSNGILHINGRTFTLADYEHIYVVGFGKASCKAALSLEKILGDYINSGIAIGLTPVACERIQTFGGTHPLPTVENVQLSEKIMELSKNATEKDLVIVIVSGGGSALLCWPMDECRQAEKLYTEFLPTGGNILELNTVRKHISQLKGGGLAKLLYPAQVIGLVFSDVPGDHFPEIASGPTYKDTTTIADAQAILDKYKLTGYNLSETPKEDKYFERVINIPLVSNQHVLDAIKAHADTLGLHTVVVSNELYDDPLKAISTLQEKAKPGTVVLAAGEPKVVVTVTNGTGGRCQRVGLVALPLLQPDDTFAAIASDGLDNGPGAGIIEDYTDAQSMNTKNIDYGKHLANFDSHGFYEQLGNCLLDTGPTEANVSDFFIYYRK